MHFCQGGGGAINGTTKQLSRPAAVGDNGQFPDFLSIDSREH